MTNLQYLAKNPQTKVAKCRIYKDRRLVYWTDNEAEAIARFNLAKNAGLNVTIFIEED